MPLTSNTIPQLPPIVAHGLTFGLQDLVGLEFDPNKPHTYCRLCGAVFQNELSRTAATPLQTEQATEGRKRWSRIHARQHSEAQHRILAASGLWVMPAAAERLAAFGIIPVTDMVVSDEVSHALQLSKPIPFNDAEGS